MQYVGKELELFAQATNWKRYWASKLRPYVRGRVLDVGCGMGTNAQYLEHAGVSAYTFLEPDADLLEQIPKHIPMQLLPRSERIQGTTIDLSGRQFDTILYLDVIEHIADSSVELARAFALLAPGGHLLILAPAHTFLWSPLDDAVGHYRRYTKAVLRSELPAGAQEVRLFHLDALGMALSLGNRFVTARSLPTEGQIRFWDRWVVRPSQVLDPLVGYRFGRSLVGIVRRPAQ
ncbi:MAG: class I SAM-dependent methyltransferase [Flavobacteriales bacterium]|nr:class I SAM-dependent methyltransferase [Flavobacteriales bacterium]